MRGFMFVVVSILILGGCASESENPPQTIDLGISEDEVASILATCPADVMPSEGLAANGAFDEERCVARIQSCVDDCRRGVGIDCFHAAHLIQIDQPRNAAVLFSWACALGEPAGCTNRAASYRQDRPMAEKLDCMLRTFEATCDAEDVWGCSMIALLSMGHEGMPRDLARAADAADRAMSLCASTPQDPVCVSAARTHDAVQAARLAETTD